MAKRRCLSNEVIETDDFLELSKDARLLYFMLNMNADDLGFIGKPKAIARQNECNTECIDELEKAGFIIRFPSGVVCICHWLIHNTLKNDRKQDTRYQEELSRIYPDDNRIYRMDTDGNHLESKRNPDGNEPETKWNPDGIQTETNGIPTEDRITEEKETEEKRREVNRSQQKQKTTEETEKQKSTEGETIPVPVPVSVSVEDEEDLLSFVTTAFGETPNDEDRESIHTLLKEGYTVQQIRGAMLVTGQSSSVWDRWAHVTGVIRKQKR